MMLRLPPITRSSYQQRPELALNFVRPQSENEGDDIENHMTAAEEEVVTETRSDSEDTVNEVGDRSGSWFDLWICAIHGSRCAIYGSLLHAGIHGSRRVAACAIYRFFTTNLPQSHIYELILLRQVALYDW